VAYRGPVVAHEPEATSMKKGLAVGSGDGGDPYIPALRCLSGSDHLCRFTVSAVAIYALAVGPTTPFKGLPPGHGEVDFIPLIKPT
jgi:hypothetical protein